MSDEELRDPWALAAVANHQDSPEARIAALESRLARLEERFQSMLEVNGLWDGS